MAIRNRDYPHPMLYKESEDYIDSNFEFNIVSQKDDRNEFVFYLDYTLSSKGLLDLIKDNKAKIIVRIDSPAASYRQVHELSDDSTIITINKNHVVKKIQFISMVVACDNIQGFKLPNEHNPEYFAGIHFNLRKGDMLAYSNQIIVTLDDSELKKPLASIFNIRSAKDAEKSIQTNFEFDKISIIVKEDVYNLYYKLRKDAAFKIFLSSILVLPVLTEAIVKMKDDIANGQGMYSDNRWYKTIEKKLEANHLEWKNSDESPVTLANILLGDIIKSAHICLNETFEKFNYGLEEE